MGGGASPGQHHDEHSDTISQFDHLTYQNADTPMFSLETLERNVSRNRGMVTALAAANNVVVVGTNRGTVIRYDFAEGGVTGAVSVLD